MPSIIRRPFHFGENRRLLSEPYGRENTVLSMFDKGKHCCGCGREPVTQFTRQVWWEWRVLVTVSPPPPQNALFFLLYNNEVINTSVYFAGLFVVVKVKCCFVLVNKFSFVRWLSCACSIRSTNPFPVTWNIAWDETPITHFVLQSWNLQTKSDK